MVYVCVRGEGEAGNESGEGGNVCVCVFGTACEAHGPVPRLGS